MSDCPDCEKKVAEAEEVKAEEVVAEAEEVKAEEVAAEAEEAVEAAAEEEKAEGTEEAAEEAAEGEKPEDKPAIKILKSLGRIAAATIIVVGLIFIIWRHEILKAWYEQRDSSTVRDLIKTQVTAGLPGTAGKDFNYEIKYHDAGVPNPNYYEVIISCPAFKNPESYKVYAEYDTVKKELKLMFENDGETNFKSIQSRLRTLKKAKPAEVQAEAPKAEAPAPAEAPAAPAK